jgi:hypothetical protein
MRDDLVEQTLRLCNALIHLVFPSFSVVSEICGPEKVSASNFLPLHHSEEMPSRRGHTRTKSPAVLTANMVPIIVITMARWSEPRPESPI